ncbi:hypothetical protein FACS1894137_18000 [Spirochaetia bacterium]|nr:hypothetical protein FACS1894137_18000 [Spirochaetia bacterium]
MKNLYTIGYVAFNDINAFIRALKVNNVEAIADVRSIPRSGYKPEFFQRLFNKATKR